MKTKELVNPYYAIFHARAYTVDSLKFLIYAGLTLLVLVIVIPINAYALIMFGLLLVYSPNILWYLHSKY